MSLIKPKVTIRWVLFVLLITISPISLARDSIVFTCSLEKSDPQYEDLLNLFRDAFDTLDMDFSMQPVPVRRAIAAASSGQADGDCFRLHDYIEISGTPNLVRVDVPVVNVDAQVWSHSPNLSVTSMGALPKVGSRVGYRRGIKWVEVFFWIGNKASRK